MPSGKNLDDGISQTLKFVNDVLRQEVGIHLMVVALDEVDNELPNDKDPDVFLKTRRFGNTAADSIHLELISLDSGSPDSPEDMGEPSMGTSVRTTTTIGDLKAKAATPIIVVPYWKDATVQIVGYNIISHILNGMGFNDNATEKGESAEKWDCDCFDDERQDSATKPCILYPMWQERNLKSSIPITDAHFPPCVRSSFQKNRGIVKQMPYVIKLTRADASESVLPICGNGLVETQNAGEINAIGEKCDCAVSDEPCTCESPTCGLSSSTEATGSSGSSILLIIVFVVGVVGLLVIGVVAFFWIRKRRTKAAAAAAGPSFETWQTIPSAAYQNVTPAMASIQATQAAAGRPTGVPPVVAAATILPEAEAAAVQPVTPAKPQSKTTSGKKQTTKRLH